jgi:hypothetical protein
MPIRPFLSGQVFDPEAIQAMSDAFTSVCAGLGLVERDDPATQLIARRIIEHAQRGVRRYASDGDPGQAWMACCGAQAATAALDRWFAFQIQGSRSATLLAG